MIPNTNSVLPKKRGPKTKPGNIYGALADYRVGTNFPKRKDLFASGIHGSLNKNVHVGSKGVISVVVREEDFVYDTWKRIIYIAPLVKINSKRKPPKEIRAFSISHRTGSLIRLTRSFEHRGSLGPRQGFRYDGLFNIGNTWECVIDNTWLSHRFELVYDLNCQKYVPIPLKETRTVYNDEKRDSATDFSRFKDYHVSSSKTNGRPSKEEDDVLITFFQLDRDQKRSNIGKKIKEECDSEISNENSECFVEIEGDSEPECNLETYLDSESCLFDKCVSSSGFADPLSLSVKYEPVASSSTELLSITSGAEPLPLASTTEPLTIKYEPLVLATTAEPLAIISTAESLALDEPLPSTSTAELLSSTRISELALISPEPSNAEPLPSTSWDQPENSPDRIIQGFTLDSWDEENENKEIEADKVIFIDIEGKKVAFILKDPEKPKDEEIEKVEDKFELPPSPKSVKVEYTPDKKPHITDEKDAHHNLLTMVIINNINHKYKYIINFLLACRFHVIKQQSLPKLFRRMEINIGIVSEFQENLNKQLKFPLFESKSVSSSDYVYQPCLTTQGKKSVYDMTFGEVINLITNHNTCPCSWHDKFPLFAQEIDSLADYIIANEDSNGRLINESQSSYIFDIIKTIATRSPTTKKLKRNYVYTQNNRDTKMINDQYEELGGKPFEDLLHQLLEDLQTIIKHTAPLLCDKKCNNIDLKRSEMNNCTPVVKRRPGRPRGKSSDLSNSSQIVKNPKDPRWIKKKHFFGFSSKKRSRNKINLLYEQCRKWENRES